MCSSNFNAEGQRIHRRQTVIKTTGRIETSVCLSVIILLILYCIPTSAPCQSLEEANRLNQKVAELFQQGQYEQAIPLAKRALAIRESIYPKNHPDIATDLNDLAVLYSALGDYARAEPLYQSALAIREKTLGENHPYVATSLNELATLYQALGDYARAEPLFQRALAIRKKAYGENHPDVGESLNNLALLYQALGDHARAEPLYERALVILEKALGRNHPYVATSLNNLASLYENLGDYARAEPLFKRSLAIKEKALGKNHPDVAASLNNLAALYKALGDYARAEPLLKRSLAILEKALGKNHPDVATSLNNLGELYRALGDYARAEPLYERALAIREKSLGKDHPDVAANLNNLALLYQALGDYARAEPLFKRSLAILEKALGKNHPDVAASLNNLALLYRALGDYARAEPLFKRSLAIHEKALGKNHPTVAANLNNLAELYHTLGDYARAESLYNRSLEINKNAYGENHSRVVASLGNLAFLYLADGKIDKAFGIFREQNNPMGLGACYLAKKDYHKAHEAFQRSLPDSETSGEIEFIIADHIGLGFACEGLWNYGGARGHFQTAIDHIESQWQTLPLSARRNFLAGNVGANFTRLDAYEGMIRVIMKEKREGYQEESLRYAERIKSRTLLEILAAKGAKGTGKKDSVILAEDRSHQRTISSLAKRLSKLKSPGSKAPEGELDKVEKEMESARLDYERFINDVKLEDRELASLITVEAAPVERIRSLLDPSTTILEYLITKDRTYAWLITKKDIAVHEIGTGSEKLTAMVNDLLIPNISNKPRRPWTTITLSAMSGEEETTAAEREKNRKRFIEVTRDFYRTLLEPVAGEIETEQLIIVPHGPLHKVPFAALNDGNRFVADRYTLSVLPSSSVMEYVVTKRNRDGGKLLAFANPETEYNPLICAEEEVDSISKLFSKKEVYPNERATETRAKQRSFSSDTIHFACHGEFNDTQPMQSGLILTKDGANDGRLQVHELFGIDLKEANLVVLSACNTGLSRICGGDDLVGLSRGFIYAGAPSLLVTLWQVDDYSTSLLMEEFYKNRYRKGMSGPEALRYAQLTLKATPGYAHPYYWAPFIMIGDWK